MAKISRSRDITWRKRLIATHGQKCIECGIEGSVALHHKKALKDGGDWSESNLELLCDNCHKWKHKPKYLWFKHMHNACAKNEIVPDFVRLETDVIKQLGVPATKVAEWIQGADKDG